MVRTDEMRKNLDLTRYCRTYAAEHGKIALRIFVYLPGPKVRLGSFLNGSEQLVMVPGTDIWMWDGKHLTLCGIN